MNISPMLVRLARRVLVASCALFALLVLTGARALPASAATAPTTPTAPSFIRLIDASPDVGTVDVFVDGAAFLVNAHYASVTGYLQLPSGPHKVELALIGKGTGAPVVAQKLIVQAGVAYTVAAVGSKSSGFALQVFADDNRMVSGMATVRVYDLSPQSGTVSVAIGTGTFIGPLSYRQASNYQKLAAGQYTFTFSSAQPVFTLSDEVTLKTGMVTSLFVVGVPNGAPPLQVIDVQVKALPRQLASTGSDPNVSPVPVNASRPGPSIALPLAALAVIGIAMAWFIGFWPFPRQKGGRRRHRKLFWAALGTLLGLIFSLGGLSFASYMNHVAAPPAPTAHLIIPAISVDAPIEPVGVQPNGTMGTARQSPWSDVGLYTGGALPGERGSAVIAGHLDRPGGDPAVFWLLGALQVGDEVQFVDAQGKTLLFHVTDIEEYPLQNAPVQEIFGNTNGRFLNLTTCAGDWIPALHTRTMRLVVYTAFGPPPGNVAPDVSPATWTWLLALKHWWSLRSVLAAASSPTSLGVVPSPFSSSTSTRAVSSTSLSVTPSSLSSSTSSSATPRPSSRSVSPVPGPIPTLLPGALRPPVKVKLPGITNEISNQLTRTPVAGTVLRQANRQLTRTPVVGTVLYRVSTQLTHTSVTKTLHQVSTQVAHTPVTKTLHQVSAQVTHTTGVAKSLSQTGTHLTHTALAGKSLHQVSTQVTHTPMTKSLHQASTQVTHTTGVAKSLQRVSGQVTHTTVAHTPVGGKLLHRTKK
jgi:sortase (surface protein transpeptidase)